MTLTATATQYAEQAPKLWSAPPVNAQHICRITLVDTNQQVWLGDDGVVPSLQLPAGSVWIDAPLAAKGIPGSISITPGLTTGESNISSAVYKFLDDHNELDVWLQGKAANGYQVFGGTLEHFIIEVGAEMITDDDLSRALWYTWQLKDSVSLDNRVYSLSCADVFRDTERDIFDARSHTLMSGLEADTVTATVYLTDAEAADLTAATWAFEHAADYHVHPGEFRAIGLLSDSDGHEYISWTGMIDSGEVESAPDGFTAKKYTLLNLQRGLFGTVPRTWTFDITQALSSRRTVEAVPYAEEHPLSLAQAAYTGYTLDGRIWPWGLSIDPKNIDSASLSAGSMESYQLRITIRSPESGSAKRFVEEHCLARRGVMISNPSGALSYVAAPIGTGEPVLTLSEDNCYGANTSPLVHDETDTATSTIIQWDKNPITDTYRKTSEFSEPSALTETSALEPVTVEAPYLTTNRSTEGEIYAQARVLHARHARPVKRLKVKPHWDLAHYPPCTVVQVELPIRDYAHAGAYGATGYINIPMMIGSINRDHHNEDLTWSLIGFRPLPSALVDIDMEQLSVEEYIANGTQLTVADGIASNGQIIELGKKYYSLEPTLLPDGWPGFLTGRGDLELWVRGVLLWGSDFDGSGKGGLGGIGSVGSGAPGERGAISAPMPVGSVSVTMNWYENSEGDPGGVSSRRTSSRPPSNLPSLNGQTSTQIVASVERGRLVGLPATLMGSGGAGGDGSSYRGITEGGTVVASDTGSASGSNGGRGALSVKLLCSAGSGYVGNGAIRLNGEDGEAPLAGLCNATPGAGAGGARGQIAVFHDTPGTPWQFSETTLEARNGLSVLVGSQAQSAVAINSGRGSQVYSYYKPAQDNSNKWADAYTVQFLPRSQLTQDGTSSDNSINEFFINQRDGGVEIYTGAKPSDANYADAYITDVNLKGNEVRPYFEVFTVDGWIEYDWVNDDFKPLYSGLINMLRVYGGTSWTFGETFPTDFTPGDSFTDELSGNTYILSSDGNHHLILRGDTPVGDERNSDFALFNTLQTHEDDGFLYYVGLTSADAMPLQSSAKVSSSSARPTIVSITYSGAFSAITDETTLQPPTAASFTAYDESSGELVWTRSSDETGVIGYKVSRDGVEIGSPSGNSLYISGLDGGTTYAFSVFAYGASGESVATATNGTTLGGATSAGIFSVVSDGPTVEITGTAAMEGRGLYMEFRDAAGVTIDSETVNFSGGSVVHQPSDPASYVTWTGYVIDNNGDGFSLPDQPRAYSQ